MLWLWLGTLLAGAACLWLLRTRRLRASGARFPGPPALPFIGNGHQIGLGGSEHFFSQLLEYSLTYGERFRLFIGPLLLVFISGVKDVEHVLSSSNLIEKSGEYFYLTDWLGTGLLTAKGEKWRKRRKAITPAFHFKILESFISVFDAQTDILMNNLRKHQGNSFDVDPYITHCALDVMCEAAMGVSVNAQSDVNSEYTKAVKTALYITTSRIKNPLKQWNFIFKLCKDYIRHKKSLTLLHNFTYKMIHKRRALLRSKNQVDLTSYTEEEEYGIKKKMAFLDLLILSTVEGQPLTDIDIREEVDTFLFEGHDTTTSCINFTLYLISRHQDIQDKLYEEQLGIFSNDTRPPVHSDLLNMNYLELVIKESLRLYPSVPFIGRRVHEDMNINGMELLEGTNIIISVYQMNRNPENFPEPDKFIPERFLPDELRKKNPYSSVPFSAGPRNCIGQKFAMLEVKTTISKILRNFKLEPSNIPLLLTGDIILKSSSGVHIKLSPRTPTP